MLLFDSFSRTAMLNSIISRLKTKHRFNKNNYNIKVNDTVEQPWCRRILKNLAIQSADYFCYRFGPGQPRASTTVDQTQADWRTSTTDACAGVTVQ